MNQTMGSGSSGLVGAYATLAANVFAATAFIVPLGLFFPIQTTADFFGQWNNIFMWSAIGLALATRNLVASDGTTSQER